MKIARLGNMLFLVEDFICMRTNYEPARVEPVVEETTGFWFWKKVVARHGGQTIPAKYKFEIYLNYNGTPRRYWAEFDTAEARDAVMNRLLHQINDGAEIPDAMQNPEPNHDIVETQTAA